MAEQLTIEEQMEVLESRFYLVSRKFVAEKGLGDYKRNSADVNYLLDSWLDLRLQLGESALVGAGYGD